MTRSMHRYWRSLAALIAGAVTVVSPPALPGAGDWYVDIQNPNCPTGTGGAGDPFCSIADAIAAASDGDTVHIAPGIYAENLTVSKDLEFIGTAGRDTTVIDGTQSGTVMDIDRDRVVLLEGLSLINGLANEKQGGGIRAGAGTDLVLRSCTIRDCEAVTTSSRTARGGGLFTIQNRVHLEDCIVALNVALAWGGDCCSARSFGGGIHAVDSDLTLVDSTISGNLSRARYSGYDNYGYAFGGGIAASGGSLLIQNSTVAGNTANGDAYYTLVDEGGGIHGDQCELSIERSVVCGNAVNEGCGGGIHSDLLTMTNSTVVGNLCDYYEGVGAGVVLTSGSIDHCNIRGNQTYYSTAGVLATSDLEVSHSIIVENDSADPGRQVESPSGHIRYSNVEGGVGGTSGGIVWGIGNQSASPLLIVHASGTWNRKARFDASSATLRLLDTTASWQIDEFAGMLVQPDLGDPLTFFIVSNDSSRLWVWADQRRDQVSFKTKSYRITSDRLSAASPCIEAGDSSLKLTGRDLGGRPRLLDGDFNRSMLIDIGAQEFSHLRLRLTGTTSPGSTLTLLLDGSPGLPVFLWIGLGAGEIPFPPFGALFLDLSQPWWLLPVGNTPTSFSGTIPTNFPLGTQVVFQGLALQPATSAGNLSEGIDIVVE